MPSESSSSAGATFLDRRQRLAGLEAMARRAAARVPSIRRIVLFGSLASGRPTPRSDADLLVEVSASPHVIPRDRVPELLMSMRPLELTSQHSL